MFVRGKHSAFQDSAAVNTFDSATNTQNACESRMAILESRAWHFSRFAVRRFFVEKVEALQTFAHSQWEKMV